MISAKTGGQSFGIASRDPWQTFRAALVGPMPSQGFCPVVNSQTVTPYEKVSDFEEYVDSANASGAL